MWADDAPRRVTISETVGVVPQISARRSAIQTVWERILLKQGMSLQGAFFLLVAWALLAKLLLSCRWSRPWGGDVRGFKRGSGGDVPRCKDQEVTASKARLGPGTCVSRRVMARGRDAACGRSRDRAGWLRIYAPTRIRRGQHQIVFRPFGPRSGL